VFPRPPWQAKSKVPNSPNKKLRHGRGLPDVAANAANYLLIVDGKPKVIGGTSAVAPLWAGLIARINQKRGHPWAFSIRCCTVHTMCFVAWGQSARLRREPTAPTALGKAGIRARGWAVPMARNSLPIWLRQRPPGPHLPAGNTES
jgi:hypothetical protein